MAIITHTPHFLTNDQIYAYGPYVREMNLWTKHFEKVSVVSPIENRAVSKIHAPYLDAHISVNRVPAISLKGPVNILRAFVLLPLICYRIFNTMRTADHIHLRCPGNIGLLGCLVQILFPKKNKTAKYAGNWDPLAKQPLSYRLQRKILGNTFWTKNMKVLVYGQWPDQSQNIKGFFTASYSKLKRDEGFSKSLEMPYRFLFVGSLSHGKRPIYALKLFQRIVKKGIDARLDIYGEGAERQALEMFVQTHQLNEIVKLHGNQSSETIALAYKTSHFLLLPSKSEGWPKVVAEAMFWKCVPLVSKISCVPWMLDYGNRGLLLSLQIKEDASITLDVLKDHERWTRMAEEGQKWSHEFTLEKFDQEIEKLVR